MGLQLVKQVPSAQEIKDKYPVSKELQEVKARRDEEIKKVFLGESDKFLAIIGPCSADSEDSVCEYINRLANVTKK